MTQIARVIVQTNPDGSKHVTFTNSDAPIEDFLVSQDSDWGENTEVVEGRVLMLDMDDPETGVVEALLDHELHSAMSEHPSPVSTTRLREMAASLEEED